MIPPAMKLVGRNVLITGAAKRIGREIALTLAKRGACIVLHFHKSSKEAVGLQKEIRSLGSACHLVPADLMGSDPHGVRPLQKFIKDVRRAVPHVDVLINNASVFYPTLFGQVTEKQWDQLMTVNLKVPYFLAQAFGMEMKKRKSGKIINLVDWTGERPAERFVPYAISKAGLIAATKGLAKNLAPEVQVIGIAPGPVLPAEKASPEENEAARKKSLLKRYGSPEDVANTVRFVIEDTDFITGSVIDVDGGAALA